MFSRTENIQWKVRVRRSHLPLIVGVSNPTLAKMLSTVGDGKPKSNHINIVLTPRLNHNFGFNQSNCCRVMLQTGENFSAIFTKHN